MTKPENIKKLENLFDQILESTDDDLNSVKENLKINGYDPEAVVKKALERIDQIQKEMSTKKKKSINESKEISLNNELSIAAFTDNENNKPWDSENKDVESESKKISKKKTKK